MNKATSAQIDYLKELIKVSNIKVKPYNIETLTKSQAARLIDKLSEDTDAAKIARLNFINKDKETWST